MDVATQVPDEVETRPMPTEVGTTGPLPASTSALEGDDDLLVEELRIDDLSIDGMCGVY